MRSRSGDLLQCHGPTLPSHSCCSPHQPRAGSVQPTQAAGIWCSWLSVSRGTTVAWKPPPADTASSPRSSQHRISFPLPRANSMAVGSRASHRVDELQAVQKEPGGGEQMASLGKGTRRLAPGGLLDPVWMHVLERRRLGEAVVGTQDR